MNVLARLPVDSLFPLLGS